MQGTGYFAKQENMLYPRSDHKASSFLSCPDSTTTSAAALCAVLATVSSWFSQQLRGVRVEHAALLM